MNEWMDKVDWEKYGKSKAEDLCEDYRLSRVNCAQCSFELTFEHYLREEGLLKEPKKDEWVKCNDCGMEINLSDYTEARDLGCPNCESFDFDEERR